MTKYILLLSALLSGCGFGYSTEADYKKAAELCAPNGGLLKWMQIDQNKMSVYCVNGAWFGDVKS